MEKCRCLLHCLVILGVIAIGTNSMDDETRRASSAKVEEDAEFDWKHKRLLVSSMQALFTSSTISQGSNKTSVNNNEGNSTATMAMESSGTSVQTPIVANSEQMRLKRLLRRSKSGHKDPELKPRDADLKLESSESVDVFPTNSNVSLPATRQSIEIGNSTTFRELFSSNETKGTSGEKLEATTSSLTLSGSASTESSENWTSSSIEFDLDEKSSSLEVMNFSFTSDRSVVQPDATSTLQNKMANDSYEASSKRFPTPASATISTPAEVQPLKIIVPLWGPESEEVKSATNRTQSLAMKSENSSPVNMGSSFYERSIDQLTLPSTTDPRSVKNCRPVQLTAEEQSTKNTASEQCDPEEKGRSSPIYSSEANRDAKNDVDTTLGVAINSDKVSSANLFPDLMPIDSVEIVIFESFNDSQKGVPLQEKDESEGRSSSSTLDERLNASLSQIFPVGLVDLSHRKEITTEDSLYIMEGLGYFQNSAEDGSELETDPETTFDSPNNENYQKAREHASMDLLDQMELYAEVPRELEPSTAALGWNSYSIEHDNPFLRDGQARRRNTVVVGEDVARIPSDFDIMTSPRLTETVTDDSRPLENHTTNDVSRNWLVPLFYALLALGIVVLGWSVWYGQSSINRKQELSRVEDMDGENDPGKNDIV